MMQPLEFNLSFFLTLMSVIGGALGIIYWIRRLWWQRYEKIATRQDNKMGQLDAKLTIILNNQRHTDGVITRMAEVIDEIRQVQGKPPKFEALHHPPVPINPDPTAEELERAALLQQVEATLTQVSKQLKVKKED